MWFRNSRKRSMMLRVECPNLLSKTGISNALQFIQRRNASLFPWAAATPPGGLTFRTSGAQQRGDGRPRAGPVARRIRLDRSEKLEPAAPTSRRCSALLRRRFLLQALLPLRGWRRREDSRLTGSPSLLSLGVEPSGPPLLYCAAPAAALAAQVHSPHCRRS